MPNSQHGHVSWKTWEFDYAVSDSEGLALLNGRLNGASVFGKFSLPVIRVKYAKDGGWWNELWGIGAGPFKDQISWKLGSDHGLQKITNRNNEYVGLVHSDLGAGRHWLEICIYARIGAYHIAQQWHLSDDGYILPMVFSKGLHAKVDHVHHAYWRLDFDIDGSNDNTVYFHDSRGWFFYPKETNDTKDVVRNKQWFVKNDVTQRGAWLTPGPTDGLADGWSGIDVAVRLFNREEEKHPWPWGVGGIGPGHSANVVRQDVVLWYVAHLGHKSSGGPHEWHSAGPTIQVVARA